MDYGKYGEEFQKKLASLIEDMKPDTTSYSSCLNVGAIAAAFPNDNSNTFIPFYHAPTQSEVTTTSSCNREHTWPNSRGGGMIERDPLIIRPTLTKDNSSRGNNFYGLGSNEWDPADCGYEGARGESARIILYAATRYASIGLTLSNNPGDSSSKHTMGTLSILLEWNNEYAPSDFERKVNERYAKMGYARNPFVDCPDFANYIYDENGYRTSPYEGGEIIVSSSSTSEYSSETPISSESSSDSHGQWNLVTEADDLAVGDEFVIACNTAGAVAGALSGAILTSESATFSSDKTTILDMGEGFQTFTLGAATGGYELLTEQGALGATAVKKLAIDDGSTVWKITFSGGNATIANGDSAKGSLEYNKSSPRFTTYTSGQTAVQIYRAA